MKQLSDCVWIVCGFAACGGQAQQPAAQLGANAGAGANIAAEDDFKGCSGDIPAFEPGLQAQSDHYALRLLTATPSEPERYTSNDWTVQLTARTGATAPDVTITRGQTFMPIHGHDGRVTPQITALADPGQFRLVHLNFTMRGPWEVRLWLQSPSVTEERAVFQVCVAK